MEIKPATYIHQWVAGTRRILAEYSVLQKKPQDRVKHRCHRVFKDHTNGIKQD